MQKNKKLKIGFFNSYSNTTPPEDGVIYPPLSLVADLAEELKKMGHDVFVFSPKGSKIKANLVHNGIKPYFNSPILKKLRNSKKEIDKTNEALFYMFSDYIAFLKAKDKLQKMDIVHTHIPLYMSFFADFIKKPFLVTPHDEARKLRSHFYPLLDFQKNLHFSFLSKAQKNTHPKTKKIKKAPVIYNGINFDNFKFSDSPSDEFLFAGRMTEAKGADIAARACKRAKVKLNLVGSIPENSLFWPKVKRYLGKNIKYKGVVKREDMPKLYQKAKALVLTTRAKEAFGLVMIEAMACGTPVVALDSGAAREIVKNNVVGFVVKNESELVSALKKVDKIDRKKCREYVLKNFSLQKMAKEYEKLYYSLVNKK